MVGFSLLQTLCTHLSTIWILGGGIIYYKEPTNIIASNVLGFDEVRGKIYYITTNGIGVYNELNNDHVFILHKEPPNEIRINDITNVYPEFSRFLIRNRKFGKANFMLILGKEFL